MVKSCSIFYYLISFDLEKYTQTLVCPIELILCYIKFERRVMYWKSDVYLIVLAFYLEGKIHLKKIYNRILHFISFWLLHLFIYHKLLSCLFSCTYLDFDKSKFLSIICMSMEYDLCTKYISIFCIFIFYFLHESVVKLCLDTVYKCSILFLKLIKILNFVIIFHLSVRIKLRAKISRILCKN